MMNPYSPGQPSSAAEIQVQQQHTQVVPTNGGRKEQRYRQAHQATIMEDLATVDAEQQLQKARAGCVHHSHFTGYDINCALDCKLSARSTRVNPCPAACSH